MFVKFCGLNTSAAVAAAVNAGADAVGFVFADSPRRISPEAAAALCRDLPPEIVRVAVMRHPSVAEWQQVRERFQPDWLQTDVSDLAALDLGPDCIALPVFRDTQRLERGDWPSPLLFEGRASGSGRTADWTLAATIAARADLILAGGLSAANIASAIAAVDPWGVDVSSGVESSPGTKDPGKITDFIARARAAEKIT
jgi:phosphoribosylanthranilate isomerase